MFYRSLLLALVSLLSACSSVRAPEQDHLSLRLSLAPQQGTFNAEARLRLPRMAAGETASFILGRDITIHDAHAGRGAEVTIGPTSVPWGGLQLVQVRARQAQDAPSVRIRYSGRPNPAGDLPINMITPELIEISLDGMAVPVRQQLNSRFTVDAWIRGIPRGATFVSQGRFRRTRDGYRISRTFGDVDFAFVAAPGLRSRASEGLEFYASDLGGESAQLFLEHAPRAIRFLEARLGPMPGRPARMVMVSRPRRSGYARIGYIIVTDGGSQNTAGTAQFVAHELAHAWFSDANAASEHRWLDESLAEYVALRYREEAFGLANRDGALERKRAAAVDAAPMLGAVRTDRELYNKGPVLLFALEERIGRADMDRLIGRVAREDVGLTADFLRILAELAGGEAAVWFEQRLRS